MECIHLTGALAPLGVLSTLLPCSIGRPLLVTFAGGAHGWGDGVDAEGALLRRLRRVRASHLSSIPPWRVPLRAHHATQVKMLSQLDRPMQRTDLAVHPLTPMGSRSNAHQRSIPQTL